MRVMLKALIRERFYPLSNIISASRRTDIPAFYSDWFMDKIETGCCKYQPPMNPQKELSLCVKDVSAIVFWSRNYGCMIKKGYLKKLKNNGYDFFMHFTIVGYPEFLDPNVINTDEAIKQFKFLSRTFGKKSLCWRFDPVIFSSVTSIEERIETFEKIAENLSSYTDLCTISILDLYKKTIRNMAEKGINCYDPLNGTDPVSYSELREMLKKMVKIAKKENIGLYTCCEKKIREDKELDINININKGSCINKYWLAGIIRDKQKKEEILKLPSDYGQRKKFDCGCHKSIDIGAYDTCIHGCVYCYANKNKEKAKEYYINYIKNNKYNEQI